MSRKRSHPSNDVALVDLVHRCRRLAVRTIDLAEKLPPKSEEPFLYGQLQDTIQQMEVIVRVIQSSLENPGQGSHAHPGGLFNRIRKALSRQKRRPGHNPRLMVPHQGLQGNSWTIPLPDLVGFLASARKTGVLWVHAPNENFLIELRNGMLLHATSDDSPPGERLGEVLVSLGFVSRDKIEFHQRTARDDDPVLLGEALEKKGIITHAQLKAALTEQVQRLFHRLLETQNAIFRFQEGVQLMISQHVELNITQLLLESARFQDEADQEASKTSRMSA